MPEIFLALTVAGIIVGEIGYYGEKSRLITATALVGLGGAFLQTLLTYRFGAVQAFNRAISIDGFSLFFKLLFILLSAAGVLIAQKSTEIAAHRKSEFCALVVASCLAMCLVASSADLLLIFLSLQLMNILNYFLAAFSKGSVFSTEAAVKYLIFVAVSALFFLYGSALLFNATQTLNIYEMHRMILEHPLPRELSLVIFMLMILPLCFQFGAFPMYFWTPDVIQGSPTPVSGFLSLGSRTAGFAVAVRFLMVVFTQPAQGAGQWQTVGGLDWTQILALISGASMIIGALLAFRQASAKRMVAYLIVSQTGYLLLGLLVLDEVGLAALLYNLLVDIFSLMGVFYVLSLFQDRLGSDQLPQFRGVLGKSVFECICLILFLVSFAGLPPLPGFLGKFTLLGAAVRHQWTFLATLGMIAYAMTAASIARLSFSMVGNFSGRSSDPFSYGATSRLILGAFLVPLALIIVLAQPVLNWVGHSLKFILW